MCSSDLSPPQSPGIDERTICAVNDVIFGQMPPQYCLGRVMTPEKSLVLQCKIPISAIGTNTTCLPTDVINGLQFFPLKMTDSPSLRLCEYRYSRSILSFFSSFFLQGMDQCYLLTITVPVHIDSQIGYL